MKKVYCKPVMESEEFNVRQYVATSCNHHCNESKPGHGHPRHLDVDEEVEIVVDGVNYDAKEARLFGCHYNKKDGHDKCHHWDFKCRWHS